MLRDGSGQVAATTFTGALSGNASTATTATNATNTAVTDDTSTNATVYPTWVTANTGNLPQKTTSTKLSFNPSTGALTSTSFSGAGTGLTGTASSLTAGTVTTNANLTGDVTSSGNATTLTNAPVIAKVLTAYSAAAGTVASTDSILQAFQKLGGLVDNAAWTTYTPSAACNTLGPGTWTTNSAHQKTIGKTVNWEIDVTLTNAGTCSGTAWKFNLPSTPTTAGGGSGGEVAINGTYVICAYSAGSAVATCNTGTAIAVSERFVASGVYEGP
jgi:hypothetical protein